MHVPRFGSQSDSQARSSRDMHFTITDAIKQAEMSVKNDAMAVTDNSAFLYANVLESTQRFDG